MEQKGKRIGMSVLGVIVCAISVGLFKTATLGVDPFQSLMAGMNEVVPLSFGTMYTLASICLLLFSLIVDRHRIGIATFIDLVLVGYIVDFSHHFLQGMFPAPSLPARVVMLLIAVILMCFASAFYFTADLGVSVYDAVALILSENWKVGPFKYIRIVTDLICVAGGVVLYLLGGHKVTEILAVAGPGTIITAFFMGPLIDYFNRTAARPFLYGKAE